MSEATVKLDAIQKAEQRIRNFVHDAVFTDTANAEMRKEGYAGRSLDGGKLNDLMDELKMAVRAVAAGAGDPQGHDVRLAPLEKILAVMRDRTLPDDLALSEIQDYLTIAGYDVPLRTYADQPSGAGDRPPALHDAAIDAAEKAYWADDGVSRHNLEAAIRAYLAAVGDRPPAPRDAPRCKHYLWAVSCGDTSCELHGAYEAKWAGRGPSVEREEDFRRMVLGAVRPTPRAAPRLSEAIQEWFVVAREEIPAWLATHGANAAALDLMRHLEQSGVLAALGAASPAAAPPQEER